MWGAKVSNPAAFNPYESGGKAATTAEIMKATRDAKERLPWTLPEEEIRRRWEEFKRGDRSGGGGDQGG